MVMLPSSSLNGFNTLVVGVPGGLTTLATVCNAEVEIDLETGLAGFRGVFAEVEDDKDRIWDKERCDVGRLCCVQPET